MLLGYTGTLDCLLQVSGVVRLYTVVSPFWGFWASMLSSDKFLFGARRTSGSVLCNPVTLVCVQTVYTSISSQVAQ